MVCPYCGASTDVINSRSQKRSNQVWRRRRCLSCQTVFTTHEIIYLPQLFVVDRTNSTEAFEPDHLYSELLACLRHHQKPQEAARELTAGITQKLLKNALDGRILPQNISFEVAKALKRFDKQAYLRFVADHPSLY